MITSAPSRWFRMYGEFATDPKVQMLSEADQRRYLMLLCMRCSNGDVTLHDDEIAFQLRISNEQWLATKAVLVAKGLIDGDAKPTAWEKRQYASDSSAARVAAHRERVKQACNVTVTPPETETETETETEAETDTEVNPKELGTVSKKPRGARLPPDAVLSDDWLHAAQSIRNDLGEIAIGLIFDEFKDHWIAAAGSRGVKSDWLATWRNWVRRERGFKPGKVELRPLTGRQAAVSSYAAQAAEARGEIPGKRIIDITPEVRRVAG
jgi:hypothetical protein